jgi:hypothetical protein
MEFPLAVAVSHDAVGVPRVINGLDVEPGLSLPTMATVWLAVAPLVDESVVRAGLPNNIGLFAGVTRRFTATLEVPALVVMLTVAV